MTGVGENQVLIYLPGSMTNRIYWSTRYAYLIIISVVTNWPKIVNRPNAHLAISDKYSPVSLRPKLKTGNSLDQKAPG